MATTAVFTTYELLENVLLHLPVKDLLLSQRVCKPWRDLAQRSQKVRRALFLHPEQAQQAGKNLEKVSAPPKCILINPLFEKFMVGTDGFPPWMLRHYGLVAPVNTANPNARLTLKPAAIFCTRASWKDMHMFQPPLHSIDLNCQETGNGKLNYINIPAAGNGLLQAGYLVEQLRLHWFACPNCPIQTLDDEEIDHDESASWRLRELGDFCTVNSNISGWAMLQMLEDLKATNKQDKA